MSSLFWQGKKVLVTGGAGFIGSHLVEQFIKKNATVSIVVNTSTDIGKINRNLGKSLKNLTIIRCDLTSEVQTRNMAKGYDVIMHLAGLDGNTSYKERYAAEIFNKNSLINLNVLEAARNARIDRMLFASSIDVYPKKVKNGLLQEDVNIGVDFSSDVQGYAWSKRVGELMCRLYNKQYGLKIAISRAGNVYGPRDYEADKRSRVIPVFIDKVLKGEEITIWGDGSQKRGFIHVSDLVNGMLLLVEKYPSCDPVNIASERVISLNELAQQIGRLSKKRVKINYLKSKLKKDRDKIVDVSKAKNIIDFKEKISLEYGLLETIDYFR